MVRLILEVYKILKRLKKFAKMVLLILSTQLILLDHRDTWLGELDLRKEGPQAELA